MSDETTPDGVSPDNPAVEPGRSPGRGLDEALHRVAIEDAAIARPATPRGRVAPLHITLAGIEFPEAAALARELGEKLFWFERRTYSVDPGGGYPFVAED